jgi:hypothetical protein
MPGDTGDPLICAQAFGEALDLAGWTGSAATRSPSTASSNACHIVYPGRDMTIALDRISPPNASVCSCGPSPRYRGSPGRSTECLSHRQRAHRHGWRPGAGRASSHAPRPERPDSGQCGLRGARAALIPRAEAHRCAPRADLGYPYLHRCHDASARGGACGGSSMINEVQGRYAAGCVARGLVAALQPGRQSRTIGQDSTVF